MSLAETAHSIAAVDVNQNSIELMVVVDEDDTRGRNATKAHEQGSDANIICVVFNWICIIRGSPVGFSPVKDVCRCGAEKSIFHSAVYPELFINRSSRKLLRAIILSTHQAPTQWTHQ